MATHCRKCGKELVILTKQVFNQNSGKPRSKVVGKKCPSHGFLNIFKRHDKYDEYGRLDYFEYD